MPHSTPCRFACRLACLQSVPHALRLACGLTGRLSYFFQAYWIDPMAWAQQSLAINEFKCGPSVFAPIWIKSDLAMPVEHCLANSPPPATASSSQRRLARQHWGQAQDDVRRLCHCNLRHCNLYCNAHMVQWMNTHVPTDVHIVPCRQPPTLVFFANWADRWQFQSSFGEPGVL